MRFWWWKRHAILELAANRQAIWLGLLLVLSADFAREYDGEDLLREPWRLALPLFASLLTSVLFCSHWCGASPECPALVEQHREALTARFDDSSFTDAQRSRLQALLSLPSSNPAGDLAEQFETPSAEPQTPMEEQDR